jgi:hypothetical protein
MRMITSGEEPAPYGTTTRIGLLGQADWAQPPVQAAASATAARPLSMARRVEAGRVVMV